MTKKLKADNPSSGKLIIDGNRNATDLLKVEYASLLELYTHTENAISNVFSFYLTLLSAIAGAIIVLIQLVSTNTIAILPSIVALLIFTTVVGIISQDSIVNKNIDLSNYALSINLLKHRLFQPFPEEMAYVFFIPNFWANVTPPSAIQTDRISRVHKRLWWLFPLGTHQLFISIIDSLALAVLILITAQVLSGYSTPLERLGIGGVVMVLMSFEAHVIYARIKHKRGTTNIVTSAGTPISWARDAG